jgi:hypothetical protein
MIEKRNLAKYSCLNHTLKVVTSKKYFWIPCYLKKEKETERGDKEIIYLSPPKDNLVNLFQMREVKI